jgi:hypothetical protein
MSSRNGPVGNLQVPLQGFIRERILLGAEATPSNLEAAVLRVLDSWHPEMVRSSFLLHSNLNFLLPF